MPFSTRLKVYSHGALIINDIVNIYILGIKEGSRMYLLVERGMAAGFCSRYYSSFRHSSSFFQHHPHHHAYQLELEGPFPHDIYYWLVLRTSSSIEYARTSSHA